MRGGRGRGSGRQRPAVGLVNLVDKDLPLGASENCPFAGLQTTAHISSWCLPSLRRRVRHTPIRARACPTHTDTRAGASDTHVVLRKRPSGRSCIALSKRKRVGGTALRV